jgi:hypothetical protein
MAYGTSAIGGTVLLPNTRRSATAIRRHFPALREDHDVRGIRFLLTLGANLFWPRTIRPQPSEHG